MGGGSPSSPSKLQGYNLRITPRKVAVIEIDYIADPEKRSPEWEEEARRMITDKEFRREYKRDWTSAVGDSFYPEFEIYGGKEVYQRASPGVLRNLPICRGWDFGFRHPACTWFQFDGDRVWVLREIMPENIDTYSFRDLVLYLSGQLSVDTLGPTAMSWVHRLHTDKSYPPPPWFSFPGARPLQFLDFSGPEALKVTATVGAETKARMDSEVLAEAGIHLSMQSMPVSARENVLRRLLKIRKDGYPGILFDDACPLIIAGMGGGIAYAKPTLQNPLPDEPAKDGYYEHLHDALGYALVQMVPMVDAPPGTPPVVEWQGRRPVESRPDEESIGWYEVAGRR